jgi:hypothetical protein
VTAFVCVLGIAVRLSDWTSERALLSAAAARAPDAYVYRRLAGTLTEEGDARAAFAAYTAAIDAPGRPMQRVCGPAVRLLADTGKTDLALRFAADHAAHPACASDGDFYAGWAEAHVAAGDADAAASTLARWTGAEQPELELPRAAVCVLRDDAACVDALRARWGPAGDDLIAKAGVLAARAKPDSP